MILPRQTRRFALVAFAAMLGACDRNLPTPPVTISGTWGGVGDPPNPVPPVSMQLTQVGDSLTGTLSYVQPDWWLLDGHYRHGTVTLVARWNVDAANPYFGQSSGTFSGHMVGADEMILSFTLPDSTPNPHSSKWAKVK